MHSEIERSLLYLWAECVFETVSAKTYKEIKEKFENKLLQLKLLNKDEVRRILE